MTPEPLSVAERVTLTGLVAYQPVQAPPLQAAVVVGALGSAVTVKLVGFDAGQTLLTALKAGQIQGLVVQNPMRMGYLGVKTLVDHLRGRPVSKVVDTGVILVTPENMDTPAVKDVVTPPLDRYLPNG